MKKRFLPFSLLLVIMILGQSVIADQGGHYVPRTQPTMNAESYMGSLRANQNTGLIDPADMFKAMQAPATKDAANDPLYWISMGPDNMGGQTTAIVYDNQSNVVYIGSKGGGVYKTYNFGVTWHQVGNLDLMVSTMVQDENGIIYVGTGDGGVNIDHNGLTDLNYSNSFIGTGIYTIDVRNNDLMTQVVTPTADEWLYINELAVAGNKLLAATPEGLKYSTDKGQTWQVALEGNADEVKVGSGNVIVASVDGMVYIGTDVNNLECHSHSGTNDMQGNTLLPKAAGLVDIAIAPKDDNVIYASCIDANGDHTGVFVSRDKGATWAKALPKVTSNLGHTIYDGQGRYNHGIVVDPTDDGILYVTGYKLWRLTRPASGDGYYQCLNLTSNTTISSTAYLHVGLHVMAFNPKNSNEYYIGTDGGVYKGDRNFEFFNCNRQYVTSRMFNVAFSGKDTRVMAAGLDHGLVMIEGEENTNTPGTGAWINPSGDDMGLWSESSSAGPCAFSMINPNTIFVTSKEGGFNRSETAGQDWVSTNFISSINFSTSNFRLPIVLFESYDADWNPGTVWYYNTSGHTQHADDVVECMSNSNYPFNYTLEANLPNGDSIEVHDPIGAKLFFTVKDNLYMTLTPLNFAVETQWIKLAGKVSNTVINHQPEAAEYNYTGGEPVCMSISADGDILYVGYRNGKLYRLTNLNTVVDAATGTYYNSGDTILNPDCQVVTKSLAFEVNGTAITQAITSVSIDPRNPNKVIVTCGNYGNDSYVFYSNNAMSDNPTFVSVQGNLPKMPVYSSVIEMATGDVIIGTERGIYRTKNIGASNVEWIANNHMMGEVPVMDLKQQLMSQEDKEVSHVTEDGIFITEYPGVHNTGVIYAATYGKGVFRCENYKVSGTSVTEAPAAVETTVSLYPNPVQGMATVSFNATENTDVNYQVFDLTGRMVMSQNIGRVAEGTQEFSINTENLSTGSYILRLNQGANSSCTKFMVY